MSTRSLTAIKDEEGVEICVLYRQMDGYPTGMGADLANFLKEITLVNGITFSDRDKKTANGMECLAAQIIAHFKDGVGDFYLSPAGTRDCGEEYLYTIYEEKGKIKLKVQVGDTTYFGLPGTEQENMPVVFNNHPYRFGKGISVEERANQLVNAGIKNDFLKKNS